MNTEKLSFFIECKDHTVSKEVFKLYVDPEYEMLITSPMPEEDQLHTYYKSEDYISHTDAKRTIIEKMYHLVKRYSLKKKIKLVSRLQKGTGTILDIGAGTGDFLMIAKEHQWKIYGIEPNEKAKTLASAKGVELQNETTTLNSNEFDVITMWHVLEHIPKLNDQIKEIKRLLKPNGYAIIAVPNYKSFDAEYYKSYWAGYDAPRHLRHFSVTSIQKLFGEHNMNLEKVVPMKFDSFYVSLLSEKYKNNRINYIRAFWVGWYSNLKGMRSKQYSSHIYILRNE